MAHRKPRTTAVATGQPTLPDGRPPQLELWPDPDQALLEEAGQEDWQDAEDADEAAREHFEPHDWE